MPDYIEELNEGQRNAVLYNDGPSLVIAGAGSGKTRVLTYKIAYLLENGYQPWNILALTFTNKAAREMKERIARQMGPERARHLWMGTFHSIFLRILHVEAGHIGFTSQFTIYDTADSKSLIRSIIKEMGLDEKVYKPGMVQARISNAKNHLVSPAGYANNKEAYEGDRAAKVPALRDIYQRYWERCRQADAMDFDDLLFYTFLLFRHHYRIKTVELRKRIESDMAAAPHYLRKIGLGIGRRVRMRLTSELLQCKTGFVDGTCRRVVYILPKNGKGTPHGK